MILTDPYAHRVYAFTSGSAGEFPQARYTFDRGKSRGTVKKEDHPVRTQHLERHAQLAVNRSDEHLNLNKKPFFKDHSQSTPCIPEAQCGQDSVFRAQTLESRAPRIERGTIGCTML